jgi:hypothetical protein
LNTDLSVAPEIAQLADPFVPAQHAAAVPRTDGRNAGDLADLAATPQRWWDLVRFDSGAPVRIPLPQSPGAWLLVMPPGTTADCDCTQATALAGEAVELSGGVRNGTRTAGDGRTGTDAVSRPLRPGRVRVHGTHGPHRVRAVGPGYSVTLHWGGQLNPF